MPLSILPNELRVLYNAKDVLKIRRNIPSSNSVVYRVYLRNGVGHCWELNKEWKMLEFRY